MKIAFHLRETFRLRNIFLYTVPLFFLSMLIITYWQFEIDSSGYPVWTPRAIAKGFVLPAFMHGGSWAYGEIILWHNFAINLLCRFAFALLLPVFIGDFLRRTKNWIRVVLWTSSMTICYCCITWLLLSMYMQSRTDFNTIGHKIIGCHIGTALSFK